MRACKLTTLRRGSNSIQRQMYVPRGASVTNWLTGKTAQDAFMQRSNVYKLRCLRDERQFSGQHRVKWNEGHCKGGNDGRRLMPWHSCMTSMTASTCYRRYIIMIMNIGLYRLLFVTFSCSSVCVLSMTNPAYPLSRYPPHSLFQTTLSCLVTSTSTKDASVQVFNKGTGIGRPRSCWYSFTSPAGTAIL